MRNISPVSFLGIQCLENLQAAGRVAKSPLIPLDVLDQTWSGGALCKKALQSNSR
ncbi:MAG: hypothetical protein K0Q73_7115 [Paenibacillus sp.]|nr:hypothetical protein [Paenibacillus sp.]